MGNCCHSYTHHVIAKVQHIRKSFRGFSLGGIYTHLNNCALLLVISLLTAVCGSRGALGEGLEGLFPRNPVFLDLKVLALVLLVRLLLVFRDEMVNVGSALTSRDVPRRSGVEDPVNNMLAHPLDHLALANISRPCSLLFRLLQHVPPPSLLLARRVETYSGNLRST